MHHYYYTVADAAYPGLAAADGTGTNRAGLLVSAQDLGHAAVRDSQLSRDYAGSDAVVGHLHYLVSDVIGQGPPVDEHTAELVDPTLAQRGGHCAATNNRTLSKTGNSNALLQRFNRFPAGQPKEA